MTGTLSKRPPATIPFLSTNSPNALARFSDSVYLRSLLFLLFFGPFIHSDHFLYSTSLQFHPLLLRNQCCPPDNPSLAQRYSSRPCSRRRTLPLSVTGSQGAST